MRPVVPAVIAALLTVGCSAAARETAAPAPGDRLIAAQYDTAVAKAQGGDAEGVLDAIAPALEGEVYSQLSKGKQYKVAELYAQAAHALGRSDEAHRAFVLATKNPAATENDWVLRLHTAIAAGDGPDANLAFRHEADARRPILATFQGRQINRFDSLLGDLPNSRDARIALGRQMEQENWTPPERYHDGGFVWLHYAEALLEAGDAQKAKAVARRISDPVAAMTLAADPRFDEVAAANPSLRDPVALAQRNLAQAQAYARQNPRELGARIAVIRLLVVLNRSKDGLAAAEEAELTMALGTRGAPAFDDMNEAPIFEGWRESLMAAAGRTDEAVGALTATATCHCSALAPMDLGQILLAAGRPAAAKRWLESANMEQLGLEDRMTLVQTKACAAVALHDDASYGKDLAYLREHEAWKPEAQVEALVCADKLGEAGATLARQLADPRRRLDALGVLQTYAAEPSASAYDTKQKERWAALKAQPTVQAAVTKVGRINRFDLQARGAIV